MDILNIQPIVVARAASGLSLILTAALPLIALAALFAATTKTPASKAKLSRSDRLVSACVMVGVLAVVAEVVCGLYVVLAQEPYAGAGHGLRQSGFLAAAMLAMDFSQYMAVAAASACIALAAWAGLRRIVARPAV